VVQRWIPARLRHRRFFSLAELNQAIRELVDTHRRLTLDNPIFPQRYSSESPHPSLRPPNCATGAHRDQRVDQVLPA
jgi:hypothetical protein